MRLPSLATLSWFAYLSVACGEVPLPGEAVDGGGDAAGDAPSSDESGYPAPGGYTDDADLSSYPQPGGYGLDSDASSDANDNSYPAPGGYDDASTSGDAGGGGDGG